MIEELNPANPEEYLTPEGWAVRERPVDHHGQGRRAGDADPALVENGPILPGGITTWPRSRPPGHVAALSWTALSGATPR
jgi:penicillin amidase